MDIAYHPIWGVSVTTLGITLHPMMWVLSFILGFALHRLWLKYHLPPSR